MAAPGRVTGEGDKRQLVAALAVRRPVALQQDVMQSMMGMQ